jgi:DNA-binding SARP family transcriptional activator
MCQLQLSLFGVPIVKHRETTLPFSTRKALALLVYLAVEGGTHTRKTLSEAFWPELDAEHGRSALRATLFELRKLLERSHDPGQRAHLLVERDLLGVAQDNSLHLDLRLIETVSKRVGSRRGAPLVDQVDRALLEQLEQATRLVRGPFLAGFTLRDTLFFDEWMRQQREYWHLRAHQLFDTLSRLYEQAGELERALEVVSRWLRFDPLDEEGYRRLMRLRFSLGDRVGALRAYTTCCEVLAHEMELEPEPETVALATWIRCTAPLHLARTRNLEPLDPSPGQPATHLLDAPYLGRSAEFGSLTDCYRLVHAGQPHFILLQGKSGIGKTRLATEFLGWAQAHGAQVLMGKALPMGKQLPYQPCIAALRQHMEQEQTHDELISDVWLAELARLLPELRDRFPNLPVPTRDDALGQSGLFEAMARLLQAWATRRPLVLLLEDLHWADTGTRDLVLYLAQSLAEQPAPLLLLLTMRTGIETFPDPHSSWVLALKRTDIPLTTLGLAPFTQEETQRFIQALAWAEQQPEKEHNDASERSSAMGSSATLREQLASFAHWLYVQTRGQPFYLMETLKGLLEQEIIVPSLQQDGSWRLVLRSELLAQTPASALIPPSVSQLLRAQLAQLTLAAWALLVAGAVMGEGLTFERLCQVARLDEETGLQALEEVLRRGWLCEDKHTEALQMGVGYIFPGEMIRSVVYQEAGTVRQRLVHHRVVAVLQEEANSGQDEEARLPHPTPIDRHAPAETRARPQRRVLTGVSSKEMSSMQMVSQSAVGTINWPLQMSRRRADTSRDKKTQLPAWERGAAVHAPFAFSRSPPGRTARGVLRRTEAEQFSTLALSTMRKGGKLG